MGHGAQATRRALIDNVKDCVAQTNAMTALATEVREANNRLAEQAGADVKRLEGRLDTVGAWCKKLENDLAIEQRFRRALRSELSQLAIEHAVFTNLSFWERLWWLLGGRWAKPGTYAEATAHVGILPTTEAPGVAHPETHGYIPAVSLGPRVLP
jgi:hypothetical protein